MKGILADVNVQGHVQVLRYVWESQAWRDIWTDLGLSLYTFADLGLIVDASDAEVWHRCQQDQLVLLTANRNDDVPDSLEATIRSHNAPTCLPVFTLADSEGILNSKGYAERTAVRLLELFMDIGNYLGTGRMYVP